MKLRYAFNYRRVGQTWLGAPCGDNCASIGTPTPSQEPTAPPSQETATPSQDPTAATPSQELTATTSSQADTFKGVLRLNEVGYFIVSHLAEETTEDEVVRLLLDEYDTTESIARASVHDVIMYLQSENVLT